MNLPRYVNDEQIIKAALEPCPVEPRPSSDLKYAGIAAPLSDDPIGFLPSLGGTPSARGQVRCKRA